MKLMKIAAFALVLTSAAVSVAGCKKMPSLPGKITGGGGGPTQTGVDAEDVDAGKKLDTYIEAHNKFVGTFGFQDSADNYRKANVANASPSGYFNVGAGWIGQGVDKLKAARAMSGGASDLDAAADTLIASMGKVQTHLTDLDTYYSSKKYLDDKLARGKAEDGAVLTELNTAGTDLDKFNVLLDREIDARDQVLLDKLKSGGNMRKYNAKLALVHAKRLADLIKTPAGSNDQALIARADAEVAIIEQAIADAHLASSKAGKGDPSGLSELTSMIGSYRSLKQGHDGSDLESMTRDYNQAVDSANTFGSMD